MATYLNGILKGSTSNGGGGGLTQAQVISLIEQYDGVFDGEYNQLPALNADNEHDVGWDPVTGHLRGQKIERKAATAPQGTFADFSDSNYYGVVADYPHSFEGGAGSFVYNRIERSFLEVLSIPPFTEYWGHVSPSDVLDTDDVFLGWHSTEEDALTHISSHDTTKTYIAYIDDLQKLRQLDNSTYVAGTAATVRRRWITSTGGLERRVHALEQTVPVFKVYRLDDFEITGVDSETVEFDLTAIKPYLDADADHAVDLILSGSATFDDSAITAGSIRFRLRYDGTNYVNSLQALSGSSPLTFELTREISASDLSSVTNVAIRVEVTGITPSTESVTISGIELIVIPALGSNGGGGLTQSQVIDLIPQYDGIIDGRPGNLPTASEDYQNVLAIDWEAGVTRICRPYLTVGTDASGTAEAYTQSDHPNYQLALPADPHGGSQSQYYYNYSAHEWRQYNHSTGQWTHVDPEDVLSTTITNVHWLGEFQTRQDFYNAISSYDNTHGYYGFIIPEVAVVALDTSANFTERVTPTTNWRWVVSSMTSLPDRVSVLEQSAPASREYTLPDVVVTGNGQEETVEFNLPDVKRFLDQSERHHVELILTANAHAPDQTGGDIILSLRYDGSASERAVTHTDATTEIELNSPVREITTLANANDVAAILENDSNYLPTTAATTFSNIKLTVIFLIRNVGSPTCYIYSGSQTSRFTTTLHSLHAGTNQNYLIVNWNPVAAGRENHRGGDVIQIDYTDIDNESDADRSNGHLNTVFELQPGKYNIQCTMYMQVTAESDTSLHLLAIQSGTDDQFVIGRAGFSRSNDRDGRIGTVLTVEYEDLEITAATKFYFMVTQVDTFYASGNNANSDASGYMRIAKVG